MHRFFFFQFQTTNSITNYFEKSATSTSTTAPSPSASTSSNRNGEHSKDNEFADLLNDGDDADFFELNSGRVKENEFADMLNDGDDTDFLDLNYWFCIYVAWVYKQFCEAH